MTSIKWNDKEIHSPFWRAMAAIFVIVVAGVLVPLGMVVLVAGLMLAAPFHPLFRLFGRKGIFQGGGNIVFDRSSFESRKGALS